MISEEIQFAKELFDKKQYSKAKEIFLKNQMAYEAGFCALLTGDMPEAKEIWKKIEDPCSATLWGLSVIEMLEGQKYVRVPGYFQVRSFLEVYINLFYENELIAWANTLVRSCGFLSRYNPETPKFLARVMLGVGFNTMVYEFANMAIDFCRQDPEAYYIKAQAYLSDKNPKSAVDSLNKILEFLPEYYPAKRFKKEIIDSGYVIEG